MGVVMLFHHSGGFKCRVCGKEHPHSHEKAPPLRTGEDGSEDRAKVLTQRTLIPQPKQVGFHNMTPAQRLHWSKIRLLDKFARTGDTRCRDKVKQLTQRELAKILAASLFGE